MSREPIDSVFNDGLLIVTLSRPEKMNSLTADMITSLHELFATRARKDDVRCVLLTGQGRAFCAGRDLSDAEANEDAEAILGETVNPMLSALYECPIPTIAAVNGVAMGIGLGLALACDIAWAGASATFSAPFANLGGALDSGGHFFLPRLIGNQRAMEMIYTARAIGGRQAADWGLVNRVVPDSVLATSTEALARRITEGPATAYIEQKKLVRQSSTLNHREILAAEASLQGMLSATVDYAEGVAAFLEKRKPDFRHASD